jgi:hypothetical protein
MKIIFQADKLSFRRFHFFRLDAIFSIALTRFSMGGGILMPFSQGVKFSHVCNAS